MAEHNQGYKLCPITGLVDCRLRKCELHYMDASIRLAPPTSQKDQALAALAQREREQQVKHDAALACLVTEAKSAIRLGQYRLAIYLLSDDSLNYQRSLD